MGMLSRYAVVAALVVAAASAHGAEAVTASPGVLLRITVADRPDVTNIYRVDAAGMLQLPHIGEIGVSGLALREISGRVAARLADASGKRPSVRVELDRSLQRVLVAGEVRLPGPVTMKGPLSLMKVLAQAGSTTPGASDVLVVIHDELARSEGAAGEARTDVDIKDLRAGHDVMLHDGDTVFVPKAQLFYILGEVRNPGAYVLNPGLTIVQAVAMAGGFTERGAVGGAKIIRSVDGKAAEFDADPGRAIQADDTVQIRKRFF